MKEIFCVGDIVLDSYDRTGIVVGFDEKPNKEWIDAQSKKFICEEDTQFLSVFPLNGGSVTLSSETTKFLRKATLNDFQIAYKFANGFAKEELLKVFGFNSDGKW